MVWTFGELDAYCSLGVRVVWFGRRAALTVQLLRDGVYVESAESEALPGIDLALLAECLEHPSTSEAIHAYRDALSRSS